MAINDRHERNNVLQFFPIKPGGNIFFQWQYAQKNWSLFPTVLTTYLPTNHRFTQCTVLTVDTGANKGPNRFPELRNVKSFSWRKNWNRPLAILTDFNLNFSARFVAFFSFSPIWYLRTPLVECWNQVWRTVVQFCSNLEEQSQSASGIAHFNFCPAIAIGRGVQSNICSE